MVGILSSGWPPSAWSSFNTRSKLTPSGNNIMQQHFEFRVRIRTENRPQERSYWQIWSMQTYKSTCLYFIVIIKFMWWSSQDFCVSFNLLKIEDWDTSFPGQFVYKQPTSQNLYFWLLCWEFLGIFHIFYKLSAKVFTLK